MGTEAMTGVRNFTLNTTDVATFGALLGAASLRSAATKVVVTGQSNSS
jgi:hypothetical protein